MEAIAERRREIRGVVVAEEVVVEDKEVVLQRIRGQHRRLKIQPISTRLNEAVFTIWEKFDLLDGIDYLHIKKTDGRTNMEHLWLPSSIEFLR